MAGLGSEVCKDCGEEFALRPSGSGRQPERCEPCRGERERRLAREAYARRREALCGPPDPSRDVESEYPEERCQECGKALDDGVPWPGRCPECRANAVGA